MTQLQKDFVAIKESYRVIMNPEDHRAGEKTFSCLGSSYDGRFLGLSRGKRALLVLCLFLISSGGSCSYEQLASVVGIASHAFLYRRCLFAVFEKTYSFLIRFKGGRWLPRTIVNELRAAAALLVFAEADLKLPVDDHLYSSDASLWGGAFGRSSEPFVKSDDDARNLLRRCDVKGTSVRIVQSDTAVGDSTADADRELPVRHSAARQAAISIDDVNWTVLKSFPFGKMRGKYCDKADGHITLFEGITFVMLLRHLASSISVANVEQGPAVLSTCLLYTSPSPRDRQKSRMPSSA